MKLSEQHRSTPLSGNNHPKLEINYSPLPAQIQQKYENTPLTAKTKTI